MSWERERGKNFSSKRLFAYIIQLCSFKSSWRLFPRIKNLLWTKVFFKNLDFFKVMHMSTLRVISFSQERLWIFPSRPSRPSLGDENFLKCSLNQTCTTLLSEQTFFCISFKNLHSLWDLELLIQFSKKLN